MIEGSGAGTGSRAGSVPLTNGSGSATLPVGKESYSVPCQEDYEASLPAELKERHERREEELSGPPPGTKSASHKKRGKAPRFSTPKVGAFKYKYLHGTKVKRDTPL
jgi:hypothetical protein